MIILSPLVHNIFFWGMCYPHILCKRFVLLIHGLILKLNINCSIVTRNYIVDNFIGHLQCGFIYKNAFNKMLLKKLKSKLIKYFYKSTLIMPLYKNKCKSLLRGKLGRLIPYVLSLLYIRVYIYTSLHPKYRQNNRQTKLHDRQIPICWKIPGSMK